MTHRLLPALALLATAGLSSPMAPAVAAPVTPASMASASPGVLTGDITLTDYSRVGETLAVQLHGDLMDATHEVAVEWLRGGTEPVYASQEIYYPLTAADRGKRILVRVTITTQDGRVQVFEKWSATVWFPAIEAYAKPAIEGAAVAGRTLAAGVPQYTEDVERVSYQWLRDGVAVTGATRATYRLTAADAGSRISLRLLAEGAELESLEQTSAPTKPVAAARTTVRLAGAVRAASVRLSLRIAAPGLVPTGDIVVQRDGKQVRRVKPSTRTITLARQPKGQHRYTIRYAGDRATLPGSASVVLRLG